MAYFIPVLLGTDREGRQSEKAAAYAIERLKKRKVETQLIDPRELPKTMDAIKPVWGPVMQRADGLLIVTPEYNHGYPPSVKLILDSCYPEYHRKPVGICGCSIGILGGARAVEQLRQVAVELHMAPIREAVYFGNIKDLFDDKGAIKDPSFDSRMDKMIDELIWYAQVLKQGRDTVPFPQG